MNLEWFWLQMSDLDPQWALGIAVVGALATVYVVYFIRKEGTEVDLEKCNGQLRLMNLFLNVARSVSNQNRFNFDQREHPMRQMIYLDVWMPVHGSQPILFIVVEVSLYQNEGMEILVMCHGTRRYFSKEEEDEALRYFRNALSVITVS